MKRNNLVILMPDGCLCMCSVTGLLTGWPKQDLVGFVSHHSKHETIIIAAARAQYLLSFVVERGTFLKYKDWSLINK